jgi:hypothetical protein
LGALSRVRKKSAPDGTGGLLGLWSMARVIDWIQTD